MLSLCLVATIQSERKPLPLREFDVSQYLRDIGAGRTPSATLHGGVDGVCVPSHMGQRLRFQC
jgi:hypothetical protein